MKILTTERSGSSYEIRLKDHLDPYWFRLFDGWSINNLENGEVILSNPDVDQAGLHGVLNKIRDLHLPLLSVRMIKNEDTKKYKFV
jgi:hypothetical protein